MGAVDDSCWLLCGSGDGGNGRGLGSRSHEIVVGGWGLLLENRTIFSSALNSTIAIDNDRSRKLLRKERIWVMGRPNLLTFRQLSRQAQTLSRLT